MAKKVVTLSDVTLMNLAKNANARRRAPILNTIFNAVTRKRAGRRGCGSCAKRAKLSQSMIQVRTALANQPAALLALKQILGADKLVIYVRGAKGLTQRKEV